MKLRLMVIGLALFFASCTGASNENEVPEKVISEAAKPDSLSQTNSSETPVQLMPAFQFEDEKGNVTSLSDLKGKKVFINLWATWCPPCRVEMPSIERLHKKVDKEEVVFIMLSLDQNFDLAKEYVKKNKLDLPIHYPASDLPQMFNTGAIPNTFIFNEKGELIKMNMGMADYDTDYYVQLLKQ